MSSSPILSPPPYFVHHSHILITPLLSPQNQQPLSHETTSTTDSDMHDSRQDVSPSYNLLSSPSLDPNHSDNRAHVMVTRSMNGSLKSRVFPSLDVSVSIAPVETTCFTQESKDSRWLTTISEEFNALVQNHTWTLVPPPPNVNIVGNKWVYRIKYGPSGSKTTVECLELGP